MRAQDDEFPTLGGVRVRNRHVGVIELLPHEVGRPKIMMCLAEGQINPAIPTRGQRILATEVMSLSHFGQTGTADQNPPEFHRSRGAISIWGALINGRPSRERCAL